jgi:hypothetical protein
MTNFKKLCKNQRIKLLFSKEILFTHIMTRFQELSSTFKGLLFYKQVIIMNSRDIFKGIIIQRNFSLRTSR